MKKLITYCLCLLLVSCGKTITVANEDRYEALRLPDGSEVYLNHWSVLTYEADFKPRTVTLEGEAFFDVVPGDTPFLVRTAQGDIRVLGTEFNVKATSEEVAVAVEEGVVELQTAYHHSEIKKGIKAFYKDGDKAIKKLTSDKAYREWTRALRKEFKQMGRELRPAMKKVGKDFKKAGKRLGKELKD